MSARLLVSTPLVIAEGRRGWFLERYDRTRALQFLAMIEDMTPLHLVAVGTRDQQGGVALLRRFAGQDLSLVDAIALHLMRERKIRSCWPTDFHRGLTGVPLVIHESPAAPRRS